MIQSSLSFGRQQAREGIERVTANAEKAVPGWANLGFAYVSLYVQRLKRGDEFTVEQLVESSIAYGIIPPHDSRAWATPIRRAQREGLIEKHPTKTGINRKRHASLCVLWRKA